MKVKELAEIFKVDVRELLDLLDNVGANIDQQEESMVDANIEKKLAKRYGVAYPFKVKKAQPKEAPAAPKAEKQPTQVSKPTSPSAQNQKPNVQAKQPIQGAQAKPSAQPNNQKKPFVNNKPNQNVNQKPQKPLQQTPSKPQVSAQPKVQQEKPLPTKVEVEKPKTIILSNDDFDRRMVDEEALSKYEQFEDEDEYEIARNARNKNQHRVSDRDPNKKKRNKDNKFKNKNKNNADLENHIIYFENGMTVKEIAEGMNVPVTELVKKLFISMGLMVGANSALDRETTELIAMDYNFEVQDKAITDMTRFDEMEFKDDEKDLETRPPVVTVMGHVDHGKTTLIDNIRATHVVQGEAGGITQHIGAYQVMKNNRLITFIDTPGHAAFTEMRARGAQITDIVVLVVAADDGVMPQTKEAIEHAQAAKVPIIVAINKMDKPTANPERIKQELTEFGLLAEEWGGDTVFVPISALRGDGVNELLEMILLVADMKDLKANPKRLGLGVVIEARLDKNRGPVATLLVQNGQIKIGDVLVVGNTYGKIRTMTNELGKAEMLATPSKPVEVTGLVEVPFAGEKFMIYNNEKKAREVAEARAFKKFEKEKGVGSTISLSEMLKNKSSEDVKQLNLIVKCDVQGSIEAIKGLLEKTKIEGTNIEIISSGVGGVVESDINLAIASQAIIVCFNVRPIAYISEMAKEHNIEIRTYSIIYKLQEDIEKAAKGLLDPIFEEKVIGQAEVREIFKVSKIGTIAGCMVTNGYVQRASGVRLIRNSIVIYTGRLSSLKRFKDDVKEVKAGYDCGMTIENYNDIKIDDVLEFFIMEEVEQ